MCPPPAPALQEYKNAPNQFTEQQYTSYHKQNVTGVVKDVADQVGPGAWSCAGA